MGKSKDLALVIRIAGKLDKSLNASLTGANSQIGKFGKTISKIGKVGMVGMAAGFAATAKTIVSCTKEAKAFEEQMSDVAKYVNGLTDANGKISNQLALNKDGTKMLTTYKENYEAMSDAILELSTRIPMTAEDLTRLAAAAGQSGKAFEDIIKYNKDGSVGGFLKDVAMMGTAMDISADLAGDYAAKWEHTFNMNHEQVMELSDQINYLGNNTATTAAEIAEVVNATGSLGQVGGIKDVGATAALADAMLAMGINAERASTTIKRMYLNLNKGSAASKKQKDTWNELGMSAEGVASSMQKDGIKTIISVFEAINQLPDEKRLSTLDVLFGSWAVEGAAKNASNMQPYIDALEMVSDASKYSGSMEKEFIVKASTASSLEMMRNNAWKRVMINVGKEFLPANKIISKSIIDALDIVNDNLPELAEIASSAAELASRGILKLAHAFEDAIPTVQNAINYFSDNAPAVIAKGIGTVGIFSAMSAVPHAVPGIKSAGQNIKKYGSDKISGIQKKTKTFGADYKSLGALGMLQKSKAGKWGQGVGEAVKGVGNTAIGTKLFAGGKLATSNAKSTLSYFVGSMVSKMPAIGMLGSGMLGAKLAGMKGAIGGAGSKVMGAAGGKIMGAAGAAGAFGKSVVGVGKAAVGPAWGLAGKGLTALLATTTPLIAGISGVVAVISILGDNLDNIRNLIRDVFGETGVSVFNMFVGRISVLYTKYIKNLFEDNGLIKALEPLREFFSGNDIALGAFDGVAGILQTLMNVIKQIADFGITYVKPIISNVFSFITGTVVPGILNIVTNSAPIISSIISTIGSVIMNIMTTIAQAIQFVLPYIGNIITGLMNIGSVVIPAILNAVLYFSTQVGAVFENVKGIFSGLIDFITGVFTGNWTLALEGIKTIFSNAFSALETLLKAPINAIISLINGVIQRINGMGLDIPDWVPVIGGNKYTVNLPEIPLLAKGGFTAGPSIAGEAGTEAVISFDKAYRSNNINTWMQAGKMLGIKNALRPLGNAPSSGQYVFSPNINITGNADSGISDSIVKELRSLFEVWLAEIEKRNRRIAY
ncbi:MAG: phage tail tape measure protein [Eubacteriales bacterium]|nr:phage tail tape measure protein [Eubacteriales bacterium]